MQRWKSRGGKSQRGDSRSEKISDGESQKRDPMIWGSGGSKSNLAKAAGAEPAGQMRDEQIARRCGAKHICK